MNCTDCIATLNRLADERTLDSALPDAVETHLYQCTSCAEVASGIQSMLDVFSVAESPQLSPRARRRVVSQLSPWRDGSRARFWAAMATAIAILVGVSTQWRQAHQHTVTAQAVEKHVPESAEPTVERSEAQLADVERTDAITDRPVYAANDPFGSGADDEELFPEWQEADGLALADALAPYSEAILVVRRSFETPVRPLSSATTEAIQSLLRDLPRQAPPPVLKYLPMLPQFETKMEAFDAFPAS